MKSEMRTTSERRRIAPCADSSRPVRSVTAPVRPGRPQQAPGEGEDLVPAAARRDASPRSRCRRGSRPTRLPSRVSRRASAVASSLSTSSFGRSIGPNPIDGDRSRRSHAVSSRSSDVLPHERRVHPRRDVPVDVPDVVARLVLAQVEEVRADSAVARCGSSTAAGRRAGGSRATRGGAGAARASRRRGCGSAPCVARRQAPPRVIRSLSASSGTGTACEDAVDDLVRVTPSARAS